LDAISRGSDLTKRGVRGVIGETVFATEVAPHATGWTPASPPGDLPYDVLMARPPDEIRIQVKLQRREKGIALMRSLFRRGPKTHYVVEVQRTRNGLGLGGIATRPYRFGEFDMIAVCMEPSTKRWQDFLYAPALALVPRKSDAQLIDIMQPVPEFPARGSPVWSDNLETALLRAVEAKALGVVPQTQASLF
jgi:hypothetical protein